MSSCQFTDAMSKKKLKSKHTKVLAETKSRQLSSRVSALLQSELTANSDSYLTILEPKLAEENLTTVESPTEPAIEPLIAIENISLEKKQPILETDNPKVIKTGQLQKNILPVNESRLIVVDSPNYSHSPQQLTNKNEEKEKLETLNENNQNINYPNQSQVTPIITISPSFTKNTETISPLNKLTDFKQKPTIKPHTQPDSDTTFNIYTSDFQQEMQIKTPNLTKNIQKSETTKQLFGLWSVIGSDIVWLGIGVGLILGVILFYFQGLQPLILNNYLSANLAQIDKLQNKFVSQTNTFIQTAQDLQKNFINKSSSLDCTTQDIYKDTEQDKINNLKPQLLPDQTLSKVEPYNNFYSTELTKMYQNLFSNYENSLSMYPPNLDTLQSTPRYYTYFNTWVKACKAFQGSQGKLSILQTACQEFITGVPNNTETKLQPTIQLATQACQNVISYKAPTTTSLINKPTIAKPAISTDPVYPNFAKWQLDWLGIYEQATAYTPLHLANLDSIYQNNQQFIDKAKQTKQNMQNYAQDRFSGLNTFYIMEFKI